MLICYTTITQLNEKRGTERRKPQAINSIDLDFDNEAFNFTKVRCEEILFTAIDRDVGCNSFKLKRVLLLLLLLLIHIILLKRYFEK